VTDVVDVDLGKEMLLKRPLCRDGEYIRASGGCSLTPLIKTCDMSMLTESICSDVPPSRSLTLAARGRSPSGKGIAHDAAEPTSSEATST